MDSYPWAEMGRKCPDPPPGYAQHPPRLAATPNPELIILNPALNPAMNPVLQLIPASLIKAYPRAMLNIHPGLLPAFGGKGMYGERVHQAVIKSGAR